MCTKDKLGKRDNGSGIYNLTLRSFKALKQYKGLKYYKRKYYSIYSFYPFKYVSHTYKTLIKNSIEQRLPIKSKLSYKTTNRYLLQSLSQDLYISHSIRIYLRSTFKPEAKPEKDVQEVYYIDKKHECTTRRVYKLNSPIEIGNPPVSVVDLECDGSVSAHITPPDAFKPETKPHQDFQEVYYIDKKPENVTRCTYLLKSPIEIENSAMSMVHLVFNVTDSTFAQRINMIGIPPPL